MAFNKARYAALIGSKIGNWTILDVFNAKCCDANRAMCRCRCVCGSEKNVFYRILKSGQSTSCGCVHFPQLKKKYPELYRKWKGMNSRCRLNYGLSKKSYLDKGISVCKEWIHNPRSFIKWSLDNGWKPGLEIDRINNDDGYSPDNCRWVSHKENCRNKENNHVIRYQDQSRCISEWAEILGVTRYVIRKMIAEGMSDSDVIKELIIRNSTKGNDEKQTD